MDYTCGFADDLRGTAETLLSYLVRQGKVTLPALPPSPLERSTSAAATLAATISPIIRARLWRVAFAVW
jgi:hypothetical protein